MKKILIGLGIIVSLLIVVAGIGIYHFLPDEDVVLDFIVDHPEKSAIKLVRNDTVMALKNSDKMMPLASTVKIIVAVEYAEQAASGKLNPDDLVALKALNNFYVPNTDGGAHKSWLTGVDSKIINDSISIREIAKGIIKYSSNANTEWLIDKLGLDNLNERLKILEMENHSELQHIVSALFVGKELFPESKGKELVEKLRKLSIDNYNKATIQIHEKLASDSTYRQDVGELGMDVQRVWSDNLPSSTVSEYVELMRKINSRTYFSDSAQKYLDEIMEVLLENLANRTWLEHAGSKGGSTAFVLTKALYATDKQGNKTEMAYFFSDLDPLENSRLQLSMNEFELKVLTDNKFRKKVKEQLSE